MIHLDRNGGDFQQGVAIAIETSGFDIDDDGQETAESIGNPLQ